MVIQLADGAGSSKTPSSCHSSHSVQQWTMCFLRHYMALQGQLCSTPRQIPCHLTQIHPPATHSGTWPGKSFLDGGLELLLLVVSFRTPPGTVLTGLSRQLRRRKVWVTTEMSQRSPMQGTLMASPLPPPVEDVQDLEEKTVNRPQFAVIYSPFLYSREFLRDQLMTSLLSVHCQLRISFLKS